MKINSHYLLILFLSLLSTSIFSQNKENFPKTGVFLSLPENLYIVEGNRLEIFKHSIINAINPDNYYLEATIINGEPKGYFYDRVYIYDAQIGDADMTIQFTIKNDKLEIIDTQKSIIHVVEKASNPLANKTVLLIGDSFTQTDVYPNELSRRLKETGGLPIADELENLTFIGTNNFDGLPREGWSGKSWSHFLSNKSPFYNPKTKQIDFENYCKVNGYKGIDYVVILLGTNDFSNNTIISSLFNKLISYNPNIKGIVTGVITPTPFGGAGSEGIHTNQTYFKGVVNSLAYNRKLETLVKNNYKATFVFADILPSLDTQNNMQFAKVPSSFRNLTTLVKQGTNNVHPAKAGYLQIADIIYNAFVTFLQ